MPRALVTGANRGLGAETAARLRARGWEVLAASRAGTPRLDVTSREDIDALVKELAAGRRLDVVVHNAGIYQGAPARIIDVNFVGPLHVNDALAPLIADGGSVVLVSSGMGELSSFSAEQRARLVDAALDRARLLALVDDYLRAPKGWPAPYSFSKGALNALARVLAAALAPRIRVNAVCPGWVRTDMGGPGAPRSVETGAASIVAAVDEQSSGGFFRDGRRIPW